MSAVLTIRALNIKGVNIIKMLNPIKLDAGPATLIPLGQVPLLKKAPREEGGYMVVPDGYDDGDVVHLYGDFSGYHLYMIATTYKKRIVEGSLDYFDRKNGVYALSLEITLDNGESRKVRVDSCQCPLHMQYESGAVYPSNITIEKYAPGTPDSLKFHFDGHSPMFKFSNNLIPNIPDGIRLDTPEICDLKIEYIGMSVGREVIREIADRLGDGHRTEAKILNRISNKETNKEAYAVLYKPTALTEGEGGPLSSKMSFPEVVETLEKSLISQFLPKRNEYSKNFPNDLSVRAKQLADLKVTNLWVKAESPLDYGLLFTDEIERKRVHRFDIKIPNY